MPERPTTPSQHIWCAIALTFLDTGPHLYRWSTAESAPRLRPMISSQKWKAGHVPTRSFKIRSSGDRSDRDGSRHAVGDGSRRRKRHASPDAFGRTRPSTLRRRRSGAADSNEPTVSDLAKGLDRTLALGGGGEYYVAWYCGFFHGLYDHGLDMAALPEMVVGTSAGSYIGSSLTSGPISCGSARNSSSSAISRRSSLASRRSLLRTPASSGR